MASLYAEQEYPEFVKPKCRLVLDMYGEYAESLDLSLEEHSEEDEEILGLVASVQSLLGHQLLNQGNKEESMEHFSRFEKGKFKFLTVSKHFKVTEAVFLYMKKDGHVGGQFVIDLDIQDIRNLLPNTRLDIIISNEEGEQVWEDTTLIRTQFFIQLRSQAVPVIQRGRYVATLAVIDPMTEEAFLHRQTIWVEHSFAGDTLADAFITDLLRIQPERS